MRTAFIKTLVQQAEQNSRVMLVVADLGFGVVDEFAKRFPKQFINTGVAEQNMVGVATGLALSGKVVFTYSIANFPIIRCLEQIRNDVCYHNANVISVSVGGGYCYGALGMTHHATEDLAIMRSLPHLQVVAPGCPKEAQAATEYFAQGAGPGYLRLGRAGEPIVHQGNISWEIGKSIQIRDGKDLTIIATGAMLKIAVDTAEQLASTKGIQSRVISMHTLKPLDEEAIIKAVAETPCIVTIEEHSIIGGLGGCVSEIICEKADRKIAFKRFGIPSEFTKHIGDQDYLRRIYGLDVSSLTDEIDKFVRAHEKACQ